MKGYRSFCPIAKAAEILAERWNLLVLRDILLGTRHFNDLRRGVPLMSPSLLAKRLRTLEEAGIIARRRGGNSHAWEYHPARAGQDLLPILQAIGQMGAAVGAQHPGARRTGPGLPDVVHALAFRHGAPATPAHRDASVLAERLGADARKRASASGRAMCSAPGSATPASAEEAGDVEEYHATPTGATQRAAKRHTPKHRSPRASSSRACVRRITQEPRS